MVHVVHRKVDVLLYGTERVDLFMKEESRICAGPVSEAETLLDILYHVV